MSKPPTAGRLPYYDSFKAVNAPPPATESDFLPPRDMRDVWKSPDYLRGNYRSVAVFPDTGGRFKHELKDPITGQSVFQFTSERGGQDGF